MNEEFEPEFDTAVKITAEQEFGMFRRICKILFEQKSFV